MTDAELLSADGLRRADGFLHDDFFRSVDLEPHTHIAGIIAGPSGWFMVCDKRSGKAFYGHA